jgi:TorA maturation chaperone TorD
MMSDFDTVQAVLESRAFNHLAFQSLFGDIVSPVLLKTLKSDAAYQSFEVYAKEGGASYAESLGAACEALAVIDVASDEVLDDLKSEYTRLFIGPDNLEAPPWESMHTSALRSLFQEVTLEVRNCYRAQGFLPAEYPRVADDHIALEFAFLAQLGSRAQMAYASADIETTRAALTASQQFLEDHLLVWLPKYVLALESAEKIDFYPVMAGFSLEFSKADKAALEELLADL